MAPIGLGCSKVDFLVLPQPELLDQARVIGKTHTCFRPHIVVHNLLQGLCRAGIPRLELHPVRSDTRVANKLLCISRSEQKPGRECGCTIL